MANRSRSFQQGRYHPINPSKYKGDLKNVIFRSSYELKMFRYCDLSDNVLEWSAEETIVPYKNPITGTTNRYFVDIYLKHQTRDGQIKKKLIEIKPAKQTREPKVRKRKSKKYLREVETYVINKAKWRAAEKFAKRHGMEFVVFTEKELGIH